MICRLRTSNAGPACGNGERWVNAAEICRAAYLLPFDQHCREIRRFMQHDAKIQQSAKEGLLIISDVDDTIKQSNTPQCTSGFTIFTLLSFLYYAATIFILSPKPVPQMPEIFRRISASDPNTKFIYVSGSPSILRSNITRFISQFYPHGDIFLNHEACFGLEQNLINYKLRKIEDVLQDNADDRVVCIGDSKQFDAEVYARIYKGHPNRVAKILIRDMSPVGNARWDSVFKDVPRHKWCVSSDVQIFGDSL